jgi:hypothetical protein
MNREEALGLLIRRHCGLSIAAYQWFGMRRHARMTHAPPN